MSEGFIWDEETSKIKSSTALSADDDDNFSIESDDEFESQLVESLNLGEANGFDFDMTFMVDDPSTSANQYLDSGSVKTFRSACAKRNTGDPMAITTGTVSILQKKQQLETSEMEIDDTPDNETQTTSTLTESTLPGDLLEQMCLKNPQMLQQILANNPHIITGINLQPNPLTQQVTQPVATPRILAPEDNMSL